MSPRLASAMNGMSSGMAARIRSSAAIPALPNASKNATLALIAAAYGDGRLDQQPAECLDTGSVVAEAGGQTGRIRVNAQAEMRVDAFDAPPEAVEEASPRQRRAGAAVNWACASTVIPLVPADQDHAGVEDR